VLAEAAELILRDRTAEHGEPEYQLADLAIVWSILLKKKLKAPITAIDISACMAATKLVRFAYNDGNLDNGRDTVGYAGIMTALQMRQQGLPATKKITF